MWIQTGITHYLLGILLTITLVAAYPYRPPTRSTKLPLKTKLSDSTGQYGSIVEIRVMSFIFQHFPVMTDMKIKLVY